MKLSQLFLTLVIMFGGLLLGACSSIVSQDQVDTGGEHGGHGTNDISVNTAPENIASPIRTIPVIANDQMRFEPESLTVQAGETIRFEVTNSGVIPHEFVLGNAHLQVEHAQSMAEGGDMPHTDQSSYTLTIPPGETASLTYTFAEADDLFYGCHIPGHYAAGMKGSITLAAVQ